MSEQGLYRKAFHLAHDGVNRLRALMFGNTEDSEVADRAMNDLNAALAILNRPRMENGWPGGVSDGLTLPCQRCGEVPRFDYRVTDGFWEYAVPEEWRLSVVCLPCLEVLGGDRVANHLLELQYTGRGFTVVTRPVLVHRYAPTPTESEEADE